MKKAIIFIAITIAVLIGGSYALSAKSGNRPASLGVSDEAALPSTLEYYWGEGCPHCKNVENFLSTWENAGKLQIDKKEVYNNTDNARLLSQRIKLCNLPQNQIGLPILITPQGKCIIGDEPIINYFKSLNL
jgi:glutaredoxin